MCEIFNWRLGFWSLSSHTVTSHKHLYLIKYKWSLCQWYTMVFQITLMYNDNDKISISIFFIILWCYLFFLIILSFCVFVTVINIYIYIFKIKIYFPILERENERQTTLAMNWWLKTEMQTIIILNVWILVKMVTTIEVSLQKKRVYKYNSIDIWFWTQDIPGYNPPPTHTLI